MAPQGRHCCHYSPVSHPENSGKTPEMAIIAR
jgi:hypothetical protein